MVFLVYQIQHFGNSLRDQKTWTNTKFSGIFFLVMTKKEAYMRIEVLYNLGHTSDFGVHHPPQHRNWMHFWGSPDGIEFPYVSRGPG